MACNCSKASSIDSRPEPHGGGGGPSNCAASARGGAGAWAKAPDEDTEIIVRTAPDLSDIADLAVAEANTLRAGGRLAAWGEALRAVERYNIAAAGARAVIAAVNYPIHSRYLPLVAGVADLDQLETAHNYSSQVTAWDLVRAGGTPGLITSVGDLAERVAAIDDEKQQRQRENEENRQESGFAPIRLR